LFDWFLAYLINDQHMGFEDTVKPQSAGSVQLCAFEQLYHIRYSLKAYFVASIDGLQAEGNRQLSLSQTRRAEEQYILMGVDPAKVERLRTYILRMLFNFIKQ